MITAQRAPVAPRVASPTTGESVRLDAVVEELRAEHATGAVMIVGEEGSGKTTALAHLAAVLEHPDQVLLLDEPVLDDALGVAANRFVVFTACSGGRIDGWTLRLLPWSRDELIEYLLAMHPEACRSVMQCLGDSWSQLTSSPYVWRIILDGLHTSPEESSPEEVLHQHASQRLEREGAAKRARTYCVASLLGLKQAAADAWKQIERTCGPEARRLLTVSCIQHTLAADQVLDTLRTRRGRKVLDHRWPYELVRVVAERLNADDRATANLQHVMERGTKSQQPMAASVLVRVIPGWRPDSTSQIKGLGGAYLQKVAWDGVDLSTAWLDLTDFTGASLCDAPLARASLVCANFSAADLRGAILHGVKGEGANFSNADLTAAAICDARFRKARFVDAILDRVQIQKTIFSECDLARARFHGAVLHRVTFHEVIVDEADFTDADLSHSGLEKADLRTTTLDGANLMGAELAQANLEDIDWPDAQLTDAKLYSAHLTGSRLPHGNLRNAVLFGAELGEIEWEGADLRGADLRSATFHMGSSRSGLLITPIASEGTRTGFYTDDCNEQHFKAPEEIRKANLCRADLRGANIDGVDFYLVDLRGALYDPGQGEIFRKCGAILDGEE